MNIKTALSVSLFLTAPLALSTATAQAQAANNLILTGAVVGRNDKGELWLRSYDRY